ncbi:MAG TPA: ABC transporter substrate-binding protein [Dehalococcoidia bacterium]|nr:ABC transporter substrate-binding protein [Dehalococcoidia bacterium]
MRRRRFLAHGTVGAAAVFTACQSARKAPISSSTTGASIDETSLTPQVGGTFQTVGFRALEHLNPWKVFMANVDFYLLGVYEQLLAYDLKPFQDYRSTYKLVGALAESWEAPDSSTYLLHVRPNVRWHDGTPFTATDVQWSLQFMSDPANSIAAGDHFRSVDSMTLLDDHTLQIKTKQPQVAFLNGLTTAPKAVIMPKHVHDRGDQFEKVAIGTGAFKVTTYDQLKGISYTASKDYWREGRPNLDGWRILAPTDEAGRLAAFTARQNDVLHVSSRRQVDTLLPLVKGARLWTFVRDIVDDFYMKLDKPPFNDKRIRQVVQMGIDRRELLKTLDAGDGLMNPPGINAVAQGWALPQSELEKLPGWRNPKSQDIQEAKQLLSQAGYGSGGLSFTVSVDQAHPTTPNQATVIAAQLRSIGITVNVQPLETTVYQKNVTSGNYDAIIDQGGTSSPGNGVWQTRFHSGGFLNSMPVHDPEMDSLIDAQAQEFDESKRKALFLEIERLLAREVYSIPLTADPGYFVGQPYVHGWVDNEGANVTCADWAQAWLDQAQAPKSR